MAEYIRKDHAIRLAKSADGEYRGISWLVAQLEMIHPADVRPVVRGRWVYHPEATRQYECDNCGCYVPGVWTYCPECGNLNGPNTITELNPGCGADMRGW